VVLFSLIAAIAVLLTPWSGFFPDLLAWPRIVLPVFLLAGFLGAVLRVRVLLAVGKLSIWLFLLYSLGSIPDPEELRAAGTLEYPTLLVLAKLSFLGAVSFGTWFCFRRVGKLNHPPSPAIEPSSR
jgi:hypothetical protein